MGKEPWKEDIYEEKEETRSERRRTELGEITANRVLTILASIFFVIVLVMIIVLVYLSTGGSNRTLALKDFHDSSTNVEQVSSSTSTEQEASATDKKEASNSENQEGTTKVLPGEGEAAIAARVGISIAQLETLNPSHMSTGSWYADPGDVVKTR
ncbi:SAG1386/EF1546 family surface-associated protein [uncultured Streptococcus sp.]|uniref:SAG1386/EF1546 family surface-associated protein n=1 Tax=uncultured Streptococcus sp. TaxID=83427 RepID=UPI0028D24776|nr:SAG1386/EF1546 family surface-associated protein [uncultured Streptococcus sp.]